MRRSGHGLVLIGLAASLAMACQTADCAMANSIDLDRTAEGYTRAAVELAQHDSQLVESWLGPAGWRLVARQPVSTIADRIRALRRPLDTGGAGTVEPERSRYRYLQGQLRALDLAARRLLGESTSFDQEAREGLGLAVAPLDEAALASARTDIDIMLPPGDSLGSRYAAFRRGFRVPGDRAEPVMRAALDACREATTEHLALPRDESLELGFVSGIPWEATARPIGRGRTRIEINVDVPLDLTRALRLACHEGYPGHHLQFLLMDAAASGHPPWAEHWLIPGLGPHLLIAEGAAEAATDLVMPSTRRVLVYRDRLAPLAGLAGAGLDDLVRIEDLAARLELAATPIARDYVDGRLTGEEAAARLGRETAVDAEQFLAFVDRRRARAVVYAEGRRVLSHDLRAAGLSRLRTLFVERPFALE